jgi:hypothetical protein
MATAIGFRVCKNDYTGVDWDDPGVTTTVGGGNVVADFHVSAHWHICCRYAMWHPVAGHQSRVVIVQYDTANIISTTGAGESDTTLMDEATQTPVTDDKTRHLISQGDPIDEFTSSEAGRLAARADDSSGVYNNGTPWTAPGVAAIVATRGL